MSLHNRAKMTTATTGTGTITLGSADTGFQTFAASGVVDQEQLFYTIEDGNAWEDGRGTYSTTGTTLSRTLIDSSTGSLLSLTGSAKVFISAPAQKLQWTQIAQTTTNGAGSYDFTSIPAVYDDLRLDVEGVSFSATAILTLALGNGTSFGTVQSFSGTQNAVDLIYGSATILGYNRNTGSAFLTAGALTADLTANNAVRNPIWWRTDGGVKALRLATTAGTFDAGTATLWGK